MKIFDVMIEGRENESTGYFITIEVASPSKAKAGEIAMEEAKKQQLSGLRIEDIEFKNSDHSINGPIVLKVYGKSYFPLEQASDLVDGN